MITIAFRGQYQLRYWEKNIKMHFYPDVVIVHGHQYHQMEWLLGDVHGELWLLNCIQFRVVHRTVGLSAVKNLWHQEKEGELIRCLSS